MRRARDARHRCGAGRRRPPAPPAGTASGPTAGTPGTRGRAVAALAAAPRRRPRRRGPGASGSTDTVVDPDGTTHVRMHRTYRGLPVVGGDLVVHQVPQAGWTGVSQTLDARL